jgi:quercetin dioxygenase-like cupin family protein
MLQGECDVRVGDRQMKIAPGQTLVIPQGVMHEVGNSGWEPAIYVCSFSATIRGTIFENPGAPGARPVSGRSSQPW